MYFSSTATYCHLIVLLVRLRENGVGIKGPSPDLDNSGVSILRKLKQGQPWSIFGKETTREYQHHEAEAGNDNSEVCLDLWILISVDQCHLHRSKIFQQTCGRGIMGTMQSEEDLCVRGRAADGIKVSEGKGEREREKVTEDRERKRECQ